MNNISLEWFLKVPGLFITAGVVLIIIALVVFLIGSKKERSEGTDGTSSGLGNEPGNSQASNTPVEPVQSNVGVSNTISPIQPVENNNTEQPGIVGVTPVVTPVVTPLVTPASNPAPTENNTIGPITPVVPNTPTEIKVDTPVVTPNVAAAVVPEASTESAPAAMDVITPVTPVGEPVAPSVNEAVAAPVVEITPAQVEPAAPVSVQPEPPVVDNAVNTLNPVITGNTDVLTPVTETVPTEPVATVEAQTASPAPETSPINNIAINQEPVAPATPEETKKTDDIEEI